MATSSEGAVGTPSIVPIPDPTDRTEQEMGRRLLHEREISSSERKVLEERLDAMDKATQLLNEQVTRVPTDVDKQVSHLKELHNERFTSVSQQFKERDTRSERESRDNKVAVDAAFAAQKEAASEQNKSNTLAIDKSEKATAETLNKQADLFKSTTDALTGQINDLKERVSRMESGRAGGVEAIHSQREASANSRATITILISAILLIITVVGFIIALQAKP